MMTSDNTTDETDEEESEEHGITTKDKTLGEFREDFTD